MNNDKPKTATNIQSIEQKIARLESMNDEALKGGGEARIEKQHENTKKKFFVSKIILVRIEPVI